MTGRGQPPKRRKQHVCVELSLPALSTNKLYAGRKRRSHHYKQFRKKVLRLLDEGWDESLVSLKGNLSLTMEVGFSSPLSDLSNAIKGIEDVLSEHFKFNDRQIVHIELNKRLVDKGSEYMKIYIKKSRKQVNYKTKNRRSK